MLKAEEMERHLKEKMPTHLMLVVEKFEQQIEMNTFMMAHFTEQMEEQVEKSMELLQQTEKRQSTTEAKLADFLKMTKIASDTSHIEAQILELKTKQRQQKDAVDVCTPGSLFMHCFIYFIVPRCVQFYYCRVCICTN